MPTAKKRPATRQSADLPSKKAAPGHDATCAIAFKLKSNICYLSTIFWGVHIIIAVSWQETNALFLSLTSLVEFAHGESKWMTRKLLSFCPQPTFQSFNTADIHLLKMGWGWWILLRQRWDPSNCCGVLGNMSCNFRYMPHDAESSNFSVHTWGHTSSQSSRRQMHRDMQNHDGSWNAIIILKYGHPKGQAPIWITSLRTSLLKESFSMIKFCIPTKVASCEMFACGQGGTSSCGQTSWSKSRRPSVPKIPLCRIAISYYNVFTPHEGDASGDQLSAGEDLSPTEHLSFGVPCEFEWHRSFPWSRTKKVSVQHW